MVSAVPSSRDVIRDRFQGLVPRLIVLYSEVSRDAGISVVALQALHVMTLNDGSMYPSELSARSGLPRSTVTRVLDALEGAGYVSRTKVAEDGRRSMVSVRRERVEEISARFDLYAEAIDAAAAAFTASELEVVARYWDLLAEAIEVSGPLQP